MGLLDKIIKGESLLGKPTSVLDPRFVMQSPGMALMREIPQGGGGGPMPGPAPMTPGSGMGIGLNPGGPGMMPPMQPGMEQQPGMGMGPGGAGFGMPMRRQRPF